MRAQMRRAAPELGDLFEELVVGVEEEGEAGCELVDVEAADEAGLDIFHAVAEGEGELLGCGGAGFADVVAGDGDGVPAGDMLGLELDGVDDELGGGLGRVDELVLGVELFEDVVLERAPRVSQEMLQICLAMARYMAQMTHAGALMVWETVTESMGDVGVEAVHVLDGVDGDAALSDFAEGEDIVGVAAHEGGEVEGGGEAGVGGGFGFGLVEDVLEACVGVVGGAEAGELAHGPEAGAVALWEEASGVGELAGVGDVAVVVLE
ncbi:MAG: hypothetical protein R3B67_00460 [Phycisphaerales bacterium]